MAVPSITMSRPALMRPVGPRTWALLLLLASAALYVVFAGTFTQPHAQDLPLFLELNEVRDWIRSQRANPLFVILFIGPRTTIDLAVELLSGLLSAIGWPALIATLALLGYVGGGIRLAALQVVGLVGIGLLGLWEPAVATLGAIVVAVAVSLLLGVPLGILAGLRPRFRRVITPVLDFMQIMPTFGYLAPLVIFFGIGPAAAVIVTLIYAMPAAIRITALGIMEVPSASVEAGTSLGATGLQLLAKVRLPQAGRAIGLAVNQTLMLALSMIVITALINAPGLGQNVLDALKKTDVGRMFDAGVGIVILAVALDRLTERGSDRLDPRRGALGEGAVSRRPRIGGPLVIAALALGGLLVPAAQEFPRVVEISFKEPVNAVVGWLRTDVSWLTTGLKDLVSYGILNPLQEIFTTAPWWLVAFLATGLALIVSGRRQAVTAALCLSAVYAIGLWQHAMETLLQVLIATAITVVLGVVIGIASARNDRLARILRPGLDAAQVMPSFVYLLPAFVLFDASRFTAIFAAVIFSVPVVIRLVDVGIRMVPEALVEAGTMSGASGWQLLVKVRLPAARRALLLAANQAVIFVLSMVVVGGLVGGQALGYDVVAGFGQTRLFGMGLAAGIVLVLLGVTLDRMTQGAGGGRKPIAEA